MAPRTERPTRRRARRRTRTSGLRRWLRRVPGRTVLLIAFGFAIASVALAAYPYTVTSDAGTSLRCGPALFEVVVPPDPAFDVPENTGCTRVAGQRLIVSGALLLVGILAAVITELRARHETRRHHGRWLEGPTRRPPRRRRRGGTRAATRRDWEPIEGPKASEDQGSISRASSAANASAAAAVSGPGHAGND